MSMKLIIIKKDNGIHEYAVVDAEDIRDSGDIDFLKKIVEVTEKFNDEAIQKG